MQRITRRDAGLRLGLFFVGWLAMLLVGIGCKGDGRGNAGELASDADPASRSGSRLHRRYVDPGGGAAMTTDFWDSLLETPCSFAPAADGVLRCLPRTETGVYFADAACSVPVYAAPASGVDCDRGWAKSRVTRHVYRNAGTPAVITGGTMYYATDSGCQSVSAVASNTYWAAELVPASEFVGGTRNDEPREGGMLARFVEGQDGSRTLLETVHAARGYRCTFDDDYRCVPSVETRTVYADTECTVPLADLYGTTVPPMIVAARTDARWCTVGRRYYETGPSVTPAQVYRINASNTCVAGSAQAGHRYYQRGPEVPLTAFPVAARAEEGSGSLRARRYVDATGAALGVAHELFDTTHGEACEPAQTSASGDLVCLPRERGYVEQGYFADAMCEGANIALVYCADPPPRVLAAPAFGLCPSFANVFPLAAAYARGAPASNDHYFENDFVTCEPRTLPTAYSVYQLGPELTLPSLALAIEPFVAPPR